MIYCLSTSFHCPLSFPCSDPLPILLSKYNVIYPDRDKAEQMKEGRSYLTGGDKLSIRAGSKRWEI